MAIGDLLPVRRARTPAARRDNGDSLVSLQQEVNRLFEDFWRGFDWPDGGMTRALAWPSVEISDTEKELKVQAELPGVEEKDVEVLLNNGVLTIRGEKKSESEDKGRRLSERYYGRFERDISLPVEVQEDKVSATFNKGVLTVTLPKSDQGAQKSKRIQITH